MERKRLVILTFTIVCLVILGVVVATLVPKHSNDVTPIPKTTTVTPKVTTVTTVAPVTPIPTSTPKPRNIIMAERLEKVINATFERVPEWRIEETKRHFKEYPWVGGVYDHTNETEFNVINNIIINNLNKTVGYDVIAFCCDLNEESVNGKHPEDAECAVLAKELNLTSYLRNHSFPLLILHFPNHNPEFVIMDGLDNITKEFPKYVSLINEYWAKYYGNKK